VNPIDRKVASDFRSVLLTRVPAGPLAHGGAARALERSSMRPVPLTKAATLQPNRADMKK